MVLRFRHGRLLEGGENALYGLKLSEVSTHVLKRKIITFLGETYAFDCDVYILSVVFATAFRLWYFICCWFSYL